MYQQVRMEPTHTRKICKPFYHGLDSLLGHRISIHRQEKISMVSHHLFRLFTTINACLHLEKCPWGKHLERKPRTRAIQMVG